MGIKPFKRLIGIIIAVVMLLAVLPTGFIVAHAESGTCGENVTWTLDSEGNLIISGTGYIWSLFNGDTPPWGYLISSAVIESGVTGIGEYAFTDCTKLTRVTIPDTVKYIDNFAFNKCTALTEITIPNGVTHINTCAFANCSGLTILTIPESVTSIGDSAFSRCSGLTRITVAETNPIYHSSGNCIIETASKTLIFGINSSIIPEDGSVTSIGKSAFSHCAGLTSITIPDGVTSIGIVAFYHCDDLTRVDLPKSVTSIAANSFDRCNNLTLYLYENSYAQQYATDKALKYQLILSGLPKGDVDGDEDVTVADALSVLRVAAKLAKSKRSVLKTGDIDNDNLITVADALGILRVAAKLAPRESLGYVAEGFDDWPPLNVGYSPDYFSGNFSPFFYEMASDGDVVAMTQINLLTSDRGGAIIEKGINGTTVNYNGTDYTYYGPADVTIVENANGTVDYNFTLREDIKFSDGEPMTIDDVIFSMYTLCDPSYSGAMAFGSLPIKGLAEYYSGWSTLNNAIFFAGIDNTDFTFWTQEQQTEFWTKYVYAIVALAQEIVDYCVNNGYAEAGDVSGAAAAWGYDVAEGGTIEDFAIELASAYGPDVANMIRVERAYSTLDTLFPGYDEFTKSIHFGESSDRIEGIVRTGDYSMTVTLDEANATAIYNFCIAIAPLHYYGDAAKYDYANNKFGFDKGDLSIIKSKSSEPMGAGPYKFIKKEAGTINFEANEYYYLGKPKTKYVNFLQVGDTFDSLTRIDAIDIGNQSELNEWRVGAIKRYNSNGELSGDKITTTLIDNLGYGYIGMCANVVKVGNDPGSDASKALRKALATVLSVYREVAIDSYYGDRASVIEYPISNTSWAAPHPNDEGYKAAFSVDKDGKDIYTDGMTAEERCAAAKAAALEFLQEAGYTISNGKAVAAPAGASLEYTAWIPAGGVGDQPCFMILTEAKKAFADIGINLIIKDLTNSADLWNALYSQEAAIWCAAWGSAVDPDMYQIYFSGDDTHTPGGSNYMYGVNDSALNKLILDGRASTNQTYRKGIYKACLDIIIDWAVEVPVYQRQNAVIFSTERVDLDTVAHDITPFYGWLNEVANIVMN